MAAENRVGLHGEPRWAQSKDGVDGKALLSRAVVGSGTESVRAGEQPLLRPPQRHFSPAAPRDDRQEREGRDRLGRHHVMANAETCRERRAVTVVPVEQLDHAGRLACRANPLLHSLAVDGVDHPDAAADDERVRATLHELGEDPAEAALVLVAEADRGIAGLPHTLELTGVQYPASPAATVASGT